MSKIYLKNTLKTRTLILSLSVLSVLVLLLWLFVLGLSSEITGPLDRYRGGLGVDPLETNSLGADPSPTPLWPRRIDWGSPEMWPVGQKEYSKFTSNTFFATIFHPVFGSVVAGGPPPGGGVE